MKKPRQTADTNGLPGFLRGTPEGTRTPNIQNRNLTLYPIELRARITGGPPQAGRPLIHFYMDSGADTPSKSNALRRVTWRAFTSPRRWLVSSGSSGLFTRVLL